MVAPVEGDDFKNIPFALACLGRRLNGYEFEFDWDWAQVPWADEMQKALADNAKALSTKDTVEVARTLYDALLKYREDAPQSEEQSEDGEQEQQEDGEQEGAEGNESKEGEGSEGAGEKKEQEGGEESGEGDDSQESNEVGEGTSQGSSEGSEGSETKQGEGKYSLDDYPETEVIQVEPQGQAFDNGKVEAQRLCNEIDPNKEVRDMDLSEGVAPSKPQGYGATRNALWRLLKADDEVGVSRKELKGKVDRKNLVNLNLNSPAVFSQRDVKEAENTAFQIFLDISGSMRKRLKADKAGEVTEHLCDIVNSTDATLNVTGFFGSGTGANMVTFKDWAKAYNKDVKKRIRHLEYYVGGGTPLYESIHWAIKDTAKQANAKKVVCVITDCEREFSQAEADYLESVAKVSNVKLFMIGVDANRNTIKMFKRSVSIDNARDLFGATFNKLINELSRERV
jgi:cobalamin biosynthesis protein CobT